jgi:hypothetical protein
MHMTLIGRISITLLTIVMAVAFAADGALAEPDAPRECTATGTGPDYAISMTVASSFCRDSIGVECETDAECTDVTAGDVCITEDQGLVRFAYAIVDSENKNPDHAVLCFDAVPVCAQSVCSVTGGPCATTNDCNGGNEDVCLVDSECIFAAGELTDPYPQITSGLELPGVGDSSTDFCQNVKSRRVMTANPNQAVSRFYLDIQGPVTCDDGDILVKTGKKRSSCSLCGPLTTAALDAGSFATTKKLLELGPCQFERVFDLSGALISSEVLLNDPSEEPCPGFVLTKDQDPESATFGQLVSKNAGEGPVGPMPLSTFSTIVDDGSNGAADFGFKRGDQAGGNEDISGPGTCATLSDGIGGSTLSCTCQKPLSPGEIRFCR